MKSSSSLLTALHIDADEVLPVDSSATEDYTTSFPSPVKDLNWKEPWETAQHSKVAQWIRCLALKANSGSYDSKCRERRSKRRGWKSKAKNQAETGPIILSRDLT
jgi:hypothetical protein